MIEVFVVILALALVIQTFSVFRLSYKVKELEEIVFSSTSYKLLGRITELEDTVGSHWTAVQREVNILWGHINGVDYYDGEEGTDEQGEDGSAEM